MSLNFNWLFFFLVFKAKIYGPEDSFINILIGERGVYCKVCEYSVGSPSPFAGYINICRFKELRVDPYTFIGLCEPGVDYNDKHAHLYCMKLVERNVDQEPTSVFLSKVQDNEFKPTPCPHANYRGHSQNVCTAYPSAEIDVAVDESTFDELFYKYLEDSPRSSFGTFSKRYIVEAMEKARAEIAASKSDRENVLARNVSKDFYFF